MWEKISSVQKDSYRRFICNFASLSKIFSQKSDLEDFKITPIVNSKFQETVFQKSFNAKAEDISNTSFDASITLDEKTKYAIGIKAFRYDSDEQKVAQFKKNSNSDGWNEIIYKINSNSLNISDRNQINKVNKDLYLELATKISLLRNERIKSSLSLIKGFENHMAIESVYHVLMPNNKKEGPKIYVGEIDYSLIDIQNIKVLGCINSKNPGNFRFTDGNHTYKYTHADSQLYMKFNNKDIIFESWDIEYLDDPFSVINNINVKKEPSEIEKSVSWMIYDKKKKVPQSSGFNAFDGGTKLPKNKRKEAIQKFIEEYKHVINSEALLFIEKELKDILLKKYNTANLIEIRKSKSRNLFEYVSSYNNLEMLNSIEKLIFRRYDEVYIPISNSAKFHNDNPDFFGEGIGLLNEDNKLMKTKEERIFDLYFIASGQCIKAYINQDSGKAIQSYGKQGTLGQWIIKDVFQLKNREKLDYDKLLDLNINAIRLIKYKNKRKFVGIEFMWIDENNPPIDAIGWVAKDKR